MEDSGCGSHSGPVIKKPEFRYGLAPSRKVVIFFFNGYAKGEFHVIHSQGYDLLIFDQIRLSENQILRQN